MLGVKPVEPLPHKCKEVVHGLWSRGVEVGLILLLFSALLQHIWFNPLTHLLTFKVNLVISYHFHYASCQKSQEEKAVSTWSQPDTPRGLLLDNLAAPDDHQTISGFQRNPNSLIFIHLNLSLNLILIPIPLILLATSAMPFHNQSK